MFDIMVEFMIGFCCLLFMCSVVSLDGVCLVRW